ncbi:outer membrane efflux protein [Sulfurihydrogenibium azorense Az-Fu1]|uniref:Outer membrane efflux protein n=1 Tax=Sulfurihydrogenibium azorense (strain DSM 15241 / OCM 825 / Az-Fu1) TaxID=204536 RepID=C1DXB9_SULAA|nr:TolC family protein [Sulfurihydrogenibium azorense]ACN98221.1 outer membrane efflux protein [Sulfurihydrogenibium azorense Az-Fu1]
MKKYIFTILGFLSLSYGETLQDILDKSIQNELIKSKESEVRVLEGELIKAKSFQNPEVYTEFGRLISKGNSSATLTEFSVSQPLLLYGVRSYRVNEAKALLESSKYNLEMFIYGYKGEIYKLFYESLYKKELMSISKQELDFSESIYNFVKKTYQLGEVSKVDLYRSEKEYNLAKINYEKAQAEYKESLKRLSSFVGFDVSDVEGDFYSFKDIKMLNFEENPEVKSYQKYQEAISQQENYFKALSKPQISFGFITKESTKNSYEAGFFISATLPTFYRYAGELTSLKHKKIQYENLKTYTLNSLKLKYETIYKTHENLKSQLYKVNTDLIPTTEKQLQLGEKSYKLKVITLFELTNIKNDYFQSLKYRLEVLDSIHKNYAEYIKIGGEI